MTIREQLEQEEHLRLSRLAQFSDATRGRLREEAETENDVRTCYQRDSDRILHSKSFRRLMHKTQVFLQPEGDHYRTRMTHTLEVARIARTITRALRLNEDLAEAIAFGHDLGHTPFGHAGEVALSEVMGTPFHHNEQSLRVVLGESHRDRINTLVTNMVFHTLNCGELGMDPEIGQAMEALRGFMFERVYKNPVAKGEESKARRILQELYEYYIKHPEKLPADFQPQVTFEGMGRTVCDYIAGMTDKYAIYKYSELFIPTAWQLRD